MKRGGYCRFDGVSEVSRLWLAPACVVVKSDLSKASILLAYRGMRVEYATNLVEKGQHHKEEFS